MRGCVIGAGEAPLGNLFLVVRGSVKGGRATEHGRRMGNRRRERVFGRTNGSSLVLSLFPRAVRFLGVGRPGSGVV